MAKSLNNIYWERKLLKDSGIFFIFVLLLLNVVVSGEEDSSKRLFIIQMCDSPSMIKSPSALPSLIDEANRHTNAKFETQPRFIKNFEDELIFSSPFIYVRFHDRTDWSLSEKEITNLREYLKRGGFLWINSSSSAVAETRKIRGVGNVVGIRVGYRPEEMEKAIKEALPEKNGFVAISDEHPINNCFYNSYPDVSKLPIEIREGLKWPRYRLVNKGVILDGKICVICTPPQKPMYTGNKSVDEFLDEVARRFGVNIIIYVLTH